MSLDGTRLVRTRTGHWRLVRSDGSTAWGTDPFGDDGDDGGGLGGLGDIASSLPSSVAAPAQSLASQFSPALSSGLGSAVSSASSGLGDISSVLGQGQGIASQIESGDVQGALQSGIQDLPAGVVPPGVSQAVSQGLGQVQGVVGQFQSGNIQGGIQAVGQLAQQGISAVSAATAGSGDSHLLTPAGAAAAATLIGQALSSGDWEEAGANAVTLIQRSSAQPSSGDQAKMVAQGAVSGIATGIGIAAAVAIVVALAEGAAIGAAIGPWGAVVGAAIGAIVGTITTLLSIHHEPSSQDELNGANSTQDQYERGGDSWFGGGTNDTGRDKYFGQVPVWYQKSITDGLTPWDLVLNGGESNGINRPLMKIDYALWLAVHPDKLTTFLKSADPKLQATIYPLMPLAIFAVTYLTYVPVLGAPGCYSPAAVDAVRQAIGGQLANAGKQVVAILKASLPPDDLTTLLYAYHYVECYDENLAGHRPIHYIDYITTRTGVWGPTSPTVKNLEVTIGQCAFAKTRNASTAKQLVAQINAQIEGGTRLDENSTVKPGWTLTSPNGKYKLAFQADGNLVVYAGSKSLWASNTAGKGATGLALQADGNLVIYAGSAPLWASNTAGKSKVHLTMQNDGNVVLYSEPSVAVWSTSTADGSTSSGLPISPDGIQALNAQIDAASKKPPVIDCLKGQTTAQVERKIGLTRAMGAPVALKATAAADKAAVAKVAAKQRADASAKAAALAAQQRAAAATKAKTAVQAAVLAKQTATKSLVKKIALGGAGALAFVGLIKLSLPKNPRPF